MVIKQIKNWLPQIHQELKAQTAELEAQVQKQNLDPLKCVLTQSSNVDSPEVLRKT